MTVSGSRSRDVHTSDSAIAGVPTAPTWTIGLPRSAKCSPRKRTRSWKSRQRLILRRRASENRRDDDRAWRNQPVRVRYFCIASEYFGMRGLNLTLSQSQRPWGLSSEECEILPERFVVRRFLRRTRRGAFIRA